MAAGMVFVWGLKRSGIHLIVNWLYANSGASRRDPLAADGLHERFFDGYADPEVGVAFYNNCGRFSCRNFELGDLGPSDFTAAAARYGHRVIFTIEDCRLSHVAQLPSGPDVRNVLVLRDPLNTVASRVQSDKSSPGLFRVDAEFVDLYESYAGEFLGWSGALPNTSKISFNRFVTDKHYRDAVAEQLGTTNVDAVHEVSSYGGGSSFSDRSEPDPPDALLSRYRQSPIPAEILDRLSAGPATVEACRSVFGYDLATTLVGG